MAQMERLSWGLRHPIFIIHSLNQSQLTLQLRKKRIKTSKEINFIGDPFRKMLIPPSLLGG